MRKYWILLSLMAVLFAFACSASAQVNTGDVIIFGRYEQDGDLSDGAEPIEWLVLTVENDRALLISRDGLDVQPYHTEYTEVTWENCALRQWLNDSFIAGAFTEEEAARIIEVRNSNPDNPEAGTEGGNETTDRVFVLSADEVKRWFPTVASRTCRATNHAKQNGVYIDMNNGNSFWWLRTPGYFPGSAAIVFSNGLLYLYGSEVRNVKRIVRPAMWLTL